MKWSNFIPIPIKIIQHLPKQIHPSNSKIPTNKTFKKYDIISISFYYNMKCHDSSRINTLMLHIRRICIAWQSRLAWPPQLEETKKRPESSIHFFRSLHPHRSLESRQCQHAPSGAYPQRLSSENFPFFYLKSLTGKHTKTDFRNPLNVHFVLWNSLFLVLSGFFWIKEVREIYGGDFSFVVLNEINRVLKFLLFWWNWCMNGLVWF